MTVHRIFYGDVRRGSVPVAPVNRCPLAINVKNQPELRMRLVLPDLDMISGAFVFQSLLPQMRLCQYGLLNFY
ncbi:hypothetical protein AWZ62_17395 [Shigella sonnei]|nr:hypothetical protein AWZ62_17395 [Shigella sonnei]